MLDERIKKLERTIARGGGDTADLEAVRGHRLAVDTILREREDVLEQLGTLSGQVDTLLEDLRSYEADPDATDFSVANLPELHPRVQEVLQSVEQARKAEEELEEALEAGRKGRPRKAAPHLH